MKVKFKVGELILKVDENEIEINNLECETEMSEEELKNYTSYCLGLFTNSFEMINNQDKDFKIY